MACDPNFASVGLLVLGNSAAGSQAFVDSSTNALAMSCSGTTQATASNPLFGLNTISVGNTAVTTPITLGGPLDLSGVATWTVEMWIYSPTLAGAFFFGMGVFGSSGMQLQTLGNNNGVQGDIYGATGAILIGNTTTHMTVNTWNHVAIVNNNNALTIYINGVGTAGPTNIGGAALPHPAWTGTCAIGDYASSPLNGQIAEFRVSNGIARYTANFTPPAAQFPIMNCTQSVPNLVGDTATQAIAANTAAGYVTTVQEANHPTVPVGIVISQQPPAGTLSVLGTNIILQLSVGPVTTAGMGGDVWGSTGGGNIQAQGQTPIGQALAYATQRDNAVVQGSQSVLASLSTGAVSPATAAQVTQNTPASQVPTAPTMG